MYGIWSDNGRELFYESADNRIMVADYTVNGDSFVPGKPRLWSDKQLFYTGTANLTLAPDGKRFAVFATPEASGPDKGTVHVTFLQNFLDGAMAAHTGRRQLMQAQGFAVRTEHPAPSPSACPGHIWACVIAVTCSGVGSIWDISWHSSIGRDAFWTAPHILIYLSGVIAGLSCGYVILAGTFGPTRAAPAVTLWGFRGPLGAFLCAWGGFAMIASAPFDNWWHNAYGLDVKVLSPPHVVLMLGMLGIRFGTLIPATSRAV